MFLIDTNVISEARKGRRANAGVQTFWAAATRDDTPLFLAAVTIGELCRGVELIRHRDDHPRQHYSTQQRQQQLEGGIKAALPLLQCAGADPADRSPLQRPLTADPGG